MHNIKSNKHSVRSQFISKVLKPMSCFGGAHGVMVIVVGNGHGDTSSSPGRD